MTRKSILHKCSRMLFIIEKEKVKTKSLKKLEILVGEKQENYREEERSQKEVKKKSERSQKEVRMKSFAWWSRTVELQEQSSRKRARRDIQLGIDRKCCRTVSKTSVEAHKSPTTMSPGETSNSTVNDAGRDRTGKNFSGKRFSKRKSPFGCRQK